MKYDHSDFVDAYKSGLIKVLVADTMAVKIASSALLPMNYRAAHVFWSWVAFMLIPFGIYFTMFQVWWGWVAHFVLRLS